MRSCRYVHTGGYKLSAPFLHVPVNSLRKVTVLLERTKDGSLSATVVQNGQRGSELLKMRHSVRREDTADAHVRDRLRKELGFEPEIEWAASGLIPRGGTVAKTE